MENTRGLSPAEIAETFGDIGLDVIPIKIMEYQQEKQEICEKIISRFKWIAENETREFERLFREAMVEETEGKRLSEINGHIKRLEGLDSRIRGEKVPFVSVERIKSEIKIEELPIFHSIKKSGKTYRAICPFHPDRDRAFTIYTESNSFYCFRCHRGGDVITLIMLLENLTFAHAAKRLKGYL